MSMEVRDDSDTVTGRAGDGSKEGAPVSAVQACIEAIRGLILNRSLVPGEQIRQGEMAQRLGVSRVPVREALKVLETEGVLSHRPNQGYYVTRLRAGELSQIYRMRELLENELLSSLEWPDRDQMDQLLAVNDALVRASEKDDILAMVARNRDFHFMIFGFSPHKVILKEVERLWSLSEPYRAVYLYGAEARGRIADEHAQIVTALGDRDEEALIDISTRHRQGLRAHMVRFLEPEGLLPRPDDRFAVPDHRPEVLL